MSLQLATEIERIAKQELGFALVGIIPASPAVTFTQTVNWIEHGYHGTMHWMESEGRLAKRTDVRQVMPEAKTIITLAYPYYTADLPPSILDDPSRGIFARYAWGRDYHRVLKGKLEHFIERIEQVVGHPVHAKAYVDTGPILEREAAQRAGLGFIGKNSMLINSQRGSYFFLCEILLDEVCEPLIHKARGGCRSCNRCGDKCPTKAIIRPGVIDSNRCISYLTIEYKGSIPEELRPLMKNRVYGCDICQEVCPWNGTAKAKELTSDWLEPELYRQAPPLLELAELTEVSFYERFAGTPIVRAKRAGLVRNVAIALGNWGSADAAVMLEKLADDKEEIVREHARWALEHLPQTPS